MAPASCNMTGRLIQVQQRDPANELYDRACDVVAAVAALRDASSSDNYDAAIAATLGCVETALEDAAAAVEQLRDASVRRLSSAWPVLGDQAVTAADDARRHFSAACAAIRAAHDACSETRGTVGPLLAVLSAS
jgi:hypothetical protein